MLILAWFDISDLFLFHVIVRLNLVFSCSNNLLSSSVDKVATGAYDFVSAILNVAFVGLLTRATAGSASGSASLVIFLVITQLSGQVISNYI